MSPIVVRIREIREGKGWSQAELADRAGTRQATISDLETGRTRRIDLELLERIAAALGVTPTALLEDAPPTPQPRRRK